MKKIIDNGHEIPYTKKWENFVFWCNECKCYHIPDSTYEEFGLSIFQTHKLINTIENLKLFEK